MVENFFDILNNYFKDRVWSYNFGPDNFANFYFLKSENDFENFDLTWVGFVLDFIDEGFPIKDIYILSLVSNCDRRDALKLKGKDIHSLGSFVANKEDIETLKTLYGFFLDCKNK